MGSFEGKRGLIFGVANKNSIAWGIAQALAEEGATLGFSYAGEALQKRVPPLANSVGSSFIEECDVTDDAAIDELFVKVENQFGNIDFLVHSIAFAPREELGGRFVDTSRAGFRIALDVSCYSLVALAKRALPLMPNGGSMLGDDLLRRGESYAKLQCNGGGEGGSGSDDSLPGLGPGQ